MRFANFYCSRAYLIYIRRRGFLFRHVPIVPVQTSHTCTAPPPPPSNEFSFFSFFLFLWGYTSYNSVLSPATNRTITNIPHIPHPTRPHPTQTPSEVKRRALRNPGLASALGGDIGSFSDVEMSTVGTASGSFGPRGGGGVGKGSGPSRVIKARFRFVGRRGGAGWAEVDVTDWEDAGGEDGTGGMEYDRVFGEILSTRYTAVSKRGQTVSTERGGRCESVTINMNCRMCGLVVPSILLSPLS